MGLSAPFSVVTFKWARPGYHSTFTAHHVNVMRHMVARHYPDPHRFICITDDPAGLEPGIEAVPIWDDHADVPNLTWPKWGPRCHRRLKVFSREFEAIAGPRFVCIDLDIVITGDLRPLWNRPDDFVIFGSLELHNWYCGSMFMMRAGSRAKVWEEFDPVESPRLAKAAGYRGTDQAWLNYILGQREARWTWNDGVYPYQSYVLRKLKGSLPPRARMVVFWGKPDPWEPAALARSPWIRNHYY